MQKVSGSIPGNIKFFFLFHQNFSFYPLFCFHYKFYIDVKARLPFKGYSKKIESGYSKFSMLLPNFQSPRLRRLVWVIWDDFQCISYTLKPYHNSVNWFLWLYRKIVNYHHLSWLYSNFVNYLYQFSTQLYMNLVNGEVKAIQKYCQLYSIKRAIPS